MDQGKSCWDPWAKRKVKSAKFHEMKNKKVVARTKALGDKAVAAFSTELKKMGFWALQTMCAWNLTWDKLR